MKIIPIDIIKGMSGKICSHSDTSITLNSSSGLMHTSKLCHPYTGPATEKQIEQQNNFKALAARVTAWLNANKPNVSNPFGTDIYRKAQALKRSLQLSNVRQVIYKYMDADGTVTLPDGSVTVTPSGGTTPNPSGGSEDDGSF